MRIPLLFVLTMTVTGAWAQDYQLVRSDMVRFYGNGNTIKHGIRIDSVAVENGDSVLYNYLTLREGSTGFGSCYYVNAPSMIGRKVVIRPDGETLMFNRWGDTLIVLTQAALQDTWSLMSIGTDTLLRATVSDISQQAWLGITDMVKTITVQAENGSGQDIDHPANGSELLIGQQLGLLRGFDLFYFPNDYSSVPGPFEVIGMEEYNAGMRRLSPAEIHDFELCDEFHFMEVKRFANLQRPPDTTYTRRVVINKSVDEELVTYQFETYGCRYHYEFPYSLIISPFPATISTESYSYEWAVGESLMQGEQVILQHDSVVTPEGAEYDFEVVQSPEYGFIDRFSQCFWQPVYYFGCELSENAQGNLMECDCDDFGHSFLERQTCMAAGLGVEYNAYYMDYITSSDVTHVSKSLVYYNKCGEEWGDPISEGLLTGLEETASTKPLSIHPNPTSSVLRFNSPASTAYTVMDASGRTVMHGRAQQGQTTLNMQNLPEGIYILLLGDGSGAARFVRAGW